MQKFKLFLASVAATSLAACAHVAPVSDDVSPPEQAAGQANADEDGAKKKKYHLTGSRIARKGSPQSRGVRVITMKRIRETGEVADLGRALQEITPVLQVQPGNIQGF